MGLSEEIRQRLINSFKAEQSEHIQKISQGLLALEKNPGNEERQKLLNEIFREAHSLKGAARAVNLTTVESLGHAMEEILLKARDGQLSFSADLFDLLYQALDGVELLMARLEAGQAAPPTEILKLLARLDLTASQGTVPTEQEPERGEQRQEAGQQETEQKQEQEVRPPVPAIPSAPDHQPQPITSQPPARTSLPAAPSPQPDETIRVSVGKLDGLMGQISELLGAKIRAEQRLAEVRQLQNSAAEWHKEWKSLRNHYNRLIRNGHGKSRRVLAPVESSPGIEDSPVKLAEPSSTSIPMIQPPPTAMAKDLNVLIDFAGHNQEQLRLLNGHINTLYQQLANDTLRLSLIIDELQEEIKRVRMLPLSTITTTFGRMVRDLARERGKQVNLNITGADTELDKRVLEQIKDPLIHLLRNAIDHGQEPPEVRRQSGKPVEGTIYLTANQQGNNVIIAISDDGGGLDLAAIRQAAARKGILSLAEAEKLNDIDTAHLIFQSGLSTNKIITDISGRGVGLDVVRQNVEDLHGTIAVSFEPGQGTTFTITMPLTLASSRGLLVQSGGQTFVLPLSNIERILQIDCRQVTSVEGQAAISYQGRPLALARLEDLLELPAVPTGNDKLMMVVITVAEKWLGLIVDGLVGEQEIVMKSLGQQLAKVGGIAGATVLGSGQVILVLHAADLIKLAARSRACVVSPTLATQPEKVENKTVLVVDDSITTRTLEKNILESAGYHVRLAIDGQEALELLATDSPPHLIISDINMPRLDGFDLTWQIKQDNRYTNIPVILVTSLDTPADKARGIEVGAEAYIVKSSFDQSNLLEAVEQLI